jgi:hypothetical protein
MQVLIHLRVGRREQKRLESTDRVFASQEKYCSFLAGTRAALNLYWHRREEKRLYGYD